MNPARIHKTRKNGFVLLEVILSVMILGIAIAALLRSFTVSLASARKAQIVTTATLLAQQILEEYEVIPPESDHMEGSFGSAEESFDQDMAAREMKQFQNYYYRVDVEEVPVEYEDITYMTRDSELDILKKISITIIYDDGHLKRFTPVRVETYLTATEKFSYTSRSENRLY